jgi:hypothetical protein
VTTGGNTDREASEERANEGDGAADANGDDNASGDGANADAEAEADNDGVEGPSPAKPQGGGLRMWRAARDRAAWKADVLHVSIPLL